MRNIFDQYSQPENKLTHALVTCLNEEKALLYDFLENIAGFSCDKKQKLIVVEQGLPDGRSFSDTDLEGRGLPDAIIFPENQEEILVIENKISSELTLDQLDRHYKTIKRYGFEKINGLTITVKNYSFSNPAWKHVYWTDVFCWAQKHQLKSKWAKSLVEYMEVLEMQITETQYLTEGTLTTFTGIPFSSAHPYNYPEAKRVLKLLMNNLKQHKELETELDLNLSHGGRGGITSGDLVWDFMPTEKLQAGEDFTKYPHYVIAITGAHTFAGVVVPNSVDSSVKKKIKELGLDGFKNIVKTVALNADKSFAEQLGCVPFIDLVQRRYPSLRSEAIEDARVQFDIRTAFEDLNGTEVQIVKTQPQWLDACYQALTVRRSNLQLAIGVKFRHDKCSIIHTKQAEELCMKAWKACAQFNKERDCK